MINFPNKKEIIKLQKSQKFALFVFSFVIFIVLFILYLFARPIILEEYCMPRAQEAAKKYSQYLIEPPKDLIEAYKSRPYLIDEHSQPSPYYVELLRCELKLSKRLYPFLHL